jgi:hypothetical protein
VYSAGIRSNFGSSYRRTQAVTRHSPSGRDSTTATREPQLFVHVTEEERMELQRAFDQAAANAGTLASSYPADSKSTLISLPARSLAPSCTHPCTHTHTHTHTHTVAFSHSSTRVQGRLGRSCCARSETRPLCARRAVSTGAMRLGGARLISWYPGVFSLSLSANKQNKASFGFNDTIGYIYPGACV